MTVEMLVVFSWDTVGHFTLHGRAWIVQVLNRPYVVAVAKKN